MKRNTALALEEVDATVRVSGVESTGYFADGQSNRLERVDVTFQFTTRDGKSHPCR